jgi:FixJ family two-component response regulator
MFRRALQMPERSKIAIVEDDPGVRRSLQLLLQGQGFDVRAYVSGEALLRDETTTNPACLIVGYLLNGVDGIELLSTMRQRGWARPAVLVTGVPSSEVWRRAADAGYSMVFEKPLRERSLVGAVSRLAGRGVDD